METALKTPASAEPLLVNTGDVDHPTPVSTALMEGYAPNEELYLYRQLPQVSPESLRLLANANYATIFHDISGRLLGSALPEDYLRETARSVFSPENFDLDEADGNLRFTVLPIVGVELVGLSDGPTAAFKDMAMGPLAVWMKHLKAKELGPLMIMLSTTGDTGPAALKAFVGLADTEIVGLMPKGAMSAFQRAQMIESHGQGGVHVIEVDGSFSDCKDLQREASESYVMNTVNSDNIGRIIAQIPYHFAAYLKAIRRNGLTIGDPVDISIPTGNFGNALSAIMARQMGLPIRNIILATNENDTVNHLFNEGVFKLSDYQKTDSSAQDVRMPSNIWRYFAMLYGFDTARVTATFDKLGPGLEGEVELCQMGKFDESIREGIRSRRVEAAERAWMIRHIYNQSQGELIVDPHTANGLMAVTGLQAVTRGVPMLVYETAKPIKFDEVMISILGRTATRPERFRDIELRALGKQPVQIANSVRPLLDYLADHTQARRRAA